MQQTITIGSDPEFLFLEKDGSRRIHASQVVPNSLRSVIGVDGHNSTAELRPHYADNAIKHYENVKSLLKKTQLCYNRTNYRITAGLSEYEAIGGHIHLGIKDSNGISLTVKILDINSCFFLNFYDQFLKEQHQRRTKRAGYGQLGAYRNKSYGIEYRTPISWLGNPLMTKSYLVLAHILAYEAVNNPKHIAKMVKTFKNLFPINEEVEEHYNMANKTFFAKYNNYFIKNIRRCELYRNSSYKATFNSLISLLHCGKKFVYDDVAKNWKLNNKIPFIVFNLKDEKLNEIKDAIGNINEILKDNMQLYVYGLKDEHNTDIITNNKSVSRYVKNFLSRNGLKRITLKYDANFLDINGIGFSMRMRRNNFIIITEILKRLNAKCATLKLKKDKLNYIENTATEKAQTDTAEENDIEPEDCGLDCCDGENCGCGDCSTC